MRGSRDNDRYFEPDNLKEARVAAEQITSVLCTLGEGPLWHVEEQALYWVDIEEKCLYTLDYASGEVTRREIGHKVGCLAFRAGGGLVLAVDAGLAWWDPAAFTLDLFADPEADNPDRAPRFNDGAVDPGGRFWAGTIAAQPEANPNGILYRLDADHSVHVMETGIGVSNGLGWSPDHRTLYYADSPRRVIYAYDYDPASGDIANRRVLVQLPANDGFPDGLTVDREGFIWCAIWDGWRVVRFAPDGGVAAEIRMPVQRPTSCMFGGPDLDELYITSARVGLDEAQRLAQPSAGGLFRVRAEVPGLPEPFYAG